MGNWSATSISYSYSYRESPQSLASGTYNNRNNDELTLDFNWRDFLYNADSLFCTISFPWTVPPRRTLFLLRNHGKSRLVSCESKQPVLVSHYSGLLSLRFVY